MCRHVAFDAFHRREGSLGFVPQVVGSWWAADGSSQVDVMALGEGVALLGECKWSTHPVDLNVLEQLQRKALALQRDDSLRRWNVRELRYALFSRSGFTQALRHCAREAQMLLLDVADLCR